MDLQENYNRYISIIKQYVTRDGVDAFIDWLNCTDAAYAPASTKYHLCVEGGFIQHSLNVLSRLIKLVASEYSEEECPYTREQLVFVALFHDVSKLGFYEKKFRNVKDPATGNWEQQAYFSVAEDDKRLFYGTHAENSLYILKQCFQMSYEEELAILYHMGELSDTGRQQDFYTAYRKSHLALLLHIADIMAMTMDEPCGQ